jgi:hypothetical protein
VQSIGQLQSYANMNHPTTTCLGLAGSVASFSTKNTFTDAKFANVSMNCSINMKIFNSWWHKNSNEFEGYPLELVPQLAIWQPVLQAAWTLP